MLYDLLRRLLLRYLYVLTQGPRVGKTERVKELNLSSKTLPLYQNFKKTKHENPLKI